MRLRADAYPTTATFEVSGMGEAIAGGADEGQGLTTEDGYLPNEVVSWTELWSDDL